MLGGPYLGPPAWCTAHPACMIPSWARSVRVFCRPWSCWSGTIKKVQSLGPWLGWRYNLQETMVSPWKYRKFSRKPIQWCRFYDLSSSHEKMKWVLGITIYNHPRKGMRTLPGRRYLSWNHCWIPNVPGRLPKWQIESQPMAPQIIHSIVKWQTASTINHD